jgi:hypothetical protein
MVFERGIGHLTRALELLAVDAKLAFTVEQHQCVDQNVSILAKAGNTNRNASTLTSSSLNDSLAASSSLLSSCAMWRLATPQWVPAG